MKPTLFATALGALALTTAAQADSRPPNIYAYATHANYCPAGLQPVTVDGSVSCGTPDQALSYRQVKTHPVVRAHRSVHRPVHARPVGIPLKGNDVYVPSGRGID